MREEIRAELEQEYAQRRAENERIEESRKREIAEKYPEIYALVREREQLVFGTLRQILNHQTREENLPEKMRSLSEQIHRKLKEAGLPENYLEPVYRCPLCRDTGYTGEPVREMCSCMKEARQRKMQTQNGLGVNDRETFEHFDLSLFSDQRAPGEKRSQRELMQRAREICEGWADAWPETTRDMLLTGPSGLGKTFLMRSMTRRLCERGKDVLMVSAYQIFQTARASYAANQSEPEELIRPAILMIDDLGSEPLMQNVTVEQLFLIINRRQELGRSTVISTNLSTEEFRARYTERIASRMMDSTRSRIIILKGKDLRQMRTNG